MSVGQFSRNERPSEAQKSAGTIVDTLPYTRWPGDADSHVSCPGKRTQQTLIRGGPVRKANQDSGAARAQRGRKSAQADPNQWIDGFAISHFVRLSARCASDEPPTRGFSVGGERPPMLQY